MIDRISPSGPVGLFTVIGTFSIPVLPPGSAVVTLGAIVPGARVGDWVGLCPLGEPFPVGFNLYALPCVVADDKVAVNVVNTSEDDFPTTDLKVIWLLAKQ